MPIPSHSTWLIIANWKTYLTAQQAEFWLLRHAADLCYLQQKAKIIICPEIASLNLIRNLAPTEISVGAQTCSDDAPGADTGKVSARSLHDLRASYCLVNHSEIQQALAKTVNQLKQLHETAITPIICFGSGDELLKIIENTSCNIIQNSILAFEPPEAIGKSALPIQILKKHFETIHKLLIERKCPSLLLYGGGVTAENCKDIRKTGLINGFLLGRASTDFQSLEKIVFSC